MAPPLLSLTGIELGFGGDDLFNGLDLSIFPGDRLALVGRNGSGKSTLLKVISGRIDVDDGERFLIPGLTVAVLDQEADLSGYECVLDYVLSGLPENDEDPHDSDYMAHSLLSGVGLDGAAKVDGLSGGERRRAALAQVLISEPQLLLLDEPTNHLDVAAIVWLEGQLKTFSGAILVISHDRRFLENVSNSTLWLDLGKMRRWQGPFSGFDDWCEEIYTVDAQSQAKLDKLIKQETSWSREGISARRKRNQGRMRRLRDLREVRADIRQRSGSVKMQSDVGKSSGKLVVEATDIHKSYGANTIINGFSTRILRGDKIGVIGANGAGKSTLLKLLTGTLPPDSGTIRLGTKLSPVFLDQNRSTLDENKTLQETLCESGGDHIDVLGEQRHIVGYLKDFLFQPGQVRSPVSSLSGGERNRLLLARSLAKPGNFLILDEPTNDLDMDTLDLLQEMLSDYQGTLLLVSHDRDFLDRVVTASYVLEGDGSVDEYPGGYSDYRRQRRQKESALKAQKNDQKKTSKNNAAKSKTVKLSYNEKRDLEILPKAIDEIEKKLVNLSEQLGKAAGDGQKLLDISATMSSLTAELTAKEERWLELEMRQESIAG